MDSYSINLTLIPIICIGRIAVVSNIQGDLHGIAGGQNH
jgi:hypothetical protein